MHDLKFADVAVAVELEPIDAAQLDFEVVAQHAASHRRAFPKDERADPPGEDLVVVLDDVGQLEVSSHYLPRKGSAAMITLKDVTCASPTAKQLCEKLMAIGVARVPGFLTTKETEIVLGPVNTKERLRVIT